MRNKLPTLGAGGKRLSHLFDEKLPATPQIPAKEEPPQRFVVQFPFSSEWEVWLDMWLKKRDPQWQAQVTSGAYGTAAYTRTDWTHETRKIDLLLDGAYWHDQPLRTAKDAYKRAVRASMGYRQVVWKAYSFTELQKSAASWYARDIG